MVGCVLATLAASSPARADLPAGSFALDGEVLAIAHAGDSTYVGGSFTKAQAVTGGGLIVAAGGAGTPDPSAFEHVAGSVRTVVADGAGGWYVAGDFSAVGDTPRDGVAHIEADGSVDGAFAPHPGAGDVLAIAVSGEHVYLGGNFRSMDGRARAGIAAVDATTGFVADFDPNPRPDPNMQHAGTVRALAASGTTIYAGGTFTHMGGQPRSSVAALNAATGTATAFAASPDDDVHAMTISGSTVFVGGTFREVGGVARKGLAGLDATSGALTSFDSDRVDGPVLALAASGGGVFVGSNGLVSLEADTGTLRREFDTGFPASSVQALAVAGSTLYAGGQFGHHPDFRDGIAAFDTATGDLTAWNPEPGGVATAIAAAGSDVYVGGNFGGAGPALHMPRRVAKLTAGGALDTGFSPSVGDGFSALHTGNRVVALAATGSAVYAAGEFFAVDGQDRSHLAALDAQTGDVTPFAAAYRASAVRTLATDGSTLYAGGDIGYVDPGASRRFLASYDLASGQITALNPTVSDNFPGVYAIGLLGSTLYAGGSFSSIAGAPRDNVAAIDATSGAATPFDPDAGAGAGPLAISVRQLSVLGSTVYLGGEFVEIGGQPRYGLAAVSALTGAVLPFQADAHEDGLLSPGLFPIGALAVSGSSVYAAGISPSDELERHRLRAYHATTGDGTGFNAQPAGGAANVLAASGSSLYAGGAFSGFGRRATGSFARLTDSGGPPPQTTISSGPADGSTTADTTPAFAFSGGAAGATFSCRVDEGPLFGCVSPFETGALGPGERSFAVAATDPTLYSDPTPAARNFRVATPATPPPPPPPAAVTPPPPPLARPNVVVAPPPPADSASFASAAKSLRVSSAGRFWYTFRATPGRSATLSMTSFAPLRIGSRRRTMTLGTKRLTVPANGRATVTFTLSRANRAALRKRSSLRFRVRATVGARRFSTLLTLKPPAR